MPVISGGFLFSNHLLSVEVEKVVVDEFEQDFFIVVQPQCNFPGAYVEGGMQIKDFLVFRSQERRAEKTKPFAYYTGPGNYSITNAKVYWSSLRPDLSAVFCSNGSPS